MKHARCSSGRSTPQRLPARGWLFVLVLSGMLGTPTLLNAQSLSWLGALRELSRPPTCEFGGGSLFAYDPALQEGISPEQRARILQGIADYHARYGYSFHPAGGPAPYPFYPQAGNLWRDVSTFYVDLDPASGSVLDWDCTDYAIDGSTGQTSFVRTFGEQDIGVPVYAALDGVVVFTMDGYADYNASCQEEPLGNSVVLWHGGAHYSTYAHLRNGSVAVAVNQTVRAGQQLGLTGSSGCSPGPRLYFESAYGDPLTPYEPSAGPCRPGPSYWVNQVPIRRDTYLRDFNMTNVLIENYPGLPYDMPRTGTFLSSAPLVSWWIHINNLPANSTWRVRFLYPDGTLYFSSGNRNFGNNVPSRGAWWWWRYNLNSSIVGTWRVQLLINNQLMMDAPFKLVATQSEIVNRPPFAIESAAFDPPRPGAGDAIFCRLNTSVLVDDPDYDLVRYRYTWRVNGNTVRQETIAAHSDAIPWGIYQPGDLLECEITPSDGQVDGPSLVVRIVPGDVDGNGCVDDADLLTVLFAFGSDNPDADANRDGIVDDADLLMVLFAFGEGC